MKTKILIGLSLFCLMSLLSACNTNKTEPVSVVIDKEQIKKEIQAKENEFAETYNSGVAKSIGYYADDAISFAQNRAPLVGKAAIVEYLMSAINESTQISIKFHLQPTKFLYQMMEIRWLKLAIIK
ncbi:MAG: hypothetical protein MZV64_07280 [Ignavibacteriales bacterium]|nr:hypothetical protein [Ignavibacteriales bacterium]